MRFQSSQTRRNFLMGAVSVMGTGIGALAGYADAQAQPRLVKVTAERFHFTPNRIELKKGETVIVEFTTLDVPMGFSAPAFKVRANILPDSPIQVPLTPNQKGEFEFFCDIVCGSGHKDMRGLFVVS